MNPSARSILKLLEHFTIRRWRVWILQMLPSTMSLVIGALILLMIIDVFQDESMWIRILLSISTWLMLSVAMWFLFRILFKSRNLREEARLIEELEPKLNESLRTSTDLILDGTGDYSSEICERLITETAVYLDRVHLRRILPWPRKSIGWSLLLTAAVLASFCFSSLHLSWRLQRLFFPSVGQGRPSLVALTPKGEAEQVVAEGEPFVVEMICDRSHDEDVILWMMGASTKRIVMTKEANQPLYRAVTRDTFSDFNYRAVCGRSLSALSHVRILPRPKVKSFKIDVKYPEYTGRSVETRSSDSGDIIVLQGSEVNVDIVSSQEIKSMQIQFGSERNPVQLHDDGQGGSFSRTVNESGNYRVLLRSVSGLAGGMDVSYRVEVLQDRPPSITWVSPSTGGWIREDQSLPLEWTWQDDFQPSRLICEWRTSSGRKNSIELPLDRRHYVIERRKMLCRTGETVSMKLIIIDGAGQRAESDEIILRVSSNPWVEQLQASDEISWRVQSRLSHAQRALELAENWRDRYREMMANSMEARHYLRLSEESQSNARESMSQACFEAQKLAESVVIPTCMTMSRQLPVKLQLMVSGNIRDEYVDGRFKKVFAQVEVLRRRIRLHRLRFQLMDILPALQKEGNQREVAELEDFRKEIMPDYPALPASGEALMKGWTGLIKEQHFGYITPSDWLENRSDRVLGSKEWDQLVTGQYPIDKRMAMWWRGWLQVEKAGVSTFTLASDDGSRLYLDGHPLVINDGDHPVLSVNAQIVLERGEHAVELWYYNREGPGSVEWTWVQPGSQESKKVMSEQLRPWPNSEKARSLDLAQTLIRYATTGLQEKFRFDASALEVPNLFLDLWGEAPELLRSGLESYVKQPLSLSQMRMATIAVNALDAGDKPSAFIAVMALDEGRAIQHFQRMQEIIRQGKSAAFAKSEVTDLLAMMSYQLSRDAHSGLAALSARLEDWLRTNEMHEELPAKEREQLDEILLEAMALASSEVARLEPDYLILESLSHELKLTPMKLEESQARLELAALMGDEEDPFAMTPEMILSLWPKDEEKEGALSQLALVSLLKKAYEVVYGWHEAGGNIQAFYGNGENDDLLSIEGIDSLDAIAWTGDSTWLDESLQLESWMLNRTQLRSKQNNTWGLLSLLSSQGKARSEWKNIFQMSSEDAIGIDAVIEKLIDIEKGLVQLRQRVKLLQDQAAQQLKKAREQVIKRSSVGAPLALRGIAKASLLLEHRRFMQARTIWLENGLGAPEAAGQSHSGIVSPCILLIRSVLNLIDKELSDEERLLTCMDLIKKRWYDLRQQIEKELLLEEQSVGDVDLLAATLPAPIQPRNIELAEQVMGLALQALMQDSSGESVRVQYGERWERANQRYLQKVMDQGRKMLSVQASSEYKKARP